MAVNMHPDYKQQHSFEIQILMKVSFLSMHWKSEDVEPDCRKTTHANREVSITLTAL